MANYKIKDINLSESGKDRLDWARHHMPIMQALKERFSVEKPFAGHKIGISLHIEAKSGVWVETMMAGGAEVAITGNPGSTQDDTAAYMVKEQGVEVYGWRSETFVEHMENAKRVMDSNPTLLSDNNADLHYLLCEEPRYENLRQSIVGATEETTSGANRLREELPRFDFPTIIINDTMAKRIVENRYGVGISVVDGMMRTTNIMLGGKKVVVIGYGYCGQGVAQRLRGLGAHVTVVDTEPMAQLEAHLEGFNVAEKEEALVGADIVLTVTGRRNVILEEHFELMKDGVLLCNAGAFEFEIDLSYLRDAAASIRNIRTDVERISMSDGKNYFLLGRGNSINLAGGDGNPIEVMDLGLALQALSLERLALGTDTLNNEPQTVPYDIEQTVLKAAVKAWI